MTLSGTIAFGECAVEVGGYRLTRGGRARGIEPKAFDVLLHLIEHRDRVVSREELLDTFWRNTEVKPGALAQTIFVVRQAVGDSGAGQRIIQTVHRRGYRFVASIVSPRGSSGVYPIATKPRSHVG